MPITGKDDLSQPSRRSEWLQRNQPNSTLRYGRHFHNRSTESLTAESAYGQRKETGRSMSVGHSISPDRFPALQTRESLTAGNVPSAVAAGDYDRDGKPDFIVSNRADHSLWIYRGKGDGTFQPPRILPLNGQGPCWMVSSDLRRNGLLDLVVAETDSRTIGILLGRGDGTFETERLLSLPAAPGFVMAGDFNRDSRIDLVVGLENSKIIGPIILFPGNGQGSFGPPVFTEGDEYRTVFYMDAADLNDDGYLDLVVVELSYWGAQVMLNNRDGTFTEGQVVHRYSGYSSGILSLKLGELNGDNRLDLLVADSWGYANVFLGKGNGTFGTSSNSYGIGNAGLCTDLVDVNGDGHLDAVIGTYILETDSPAGFLFIGLGDGQGSFQQRHIYKGDPDIISVSPADFNLDGYMDLVTANTAMYSCSLFINDRRGEFGNPIGHLLNAGAVSAVNYPAGAQFAEINGDSLPDLVLLQSLRSPSKQSIQTVSYLNDGRGGFRDPILSETGIEGNVGDFLLEDFRHTGREDMVILGFHFEEGLKSFLTFLTNLGEGRMGLSDSMACTGGWAIAAADFNRDGRLDLVYAYENCRIPSTVSDCQHLEIFLGHEDGSFTLASILDYGGSEPLFPLKIRTGDFNRDGLADILVWLSWNQMPYSNRAVVEFLGNGDSTFRPPKVVVLNISSFSMGDLNEDGNLDIVDSALISINYPDWLKKPRVDLYFGRNDGTFYRGDTLEPFDGEPFTTEWDPVVYDFNRDGHADIWVRLSGYFQILLGNGDGTFLPTYHRNLYHQHARHLFTDWDADGWEDMVEILWNRQWIMFSRGVQAPSLVFESISYPVYGCCGRAILSLNTTAQTPVTVHLSANDTSIRTPQNIVVPAGTRIAGFSFTIGKEYDPAKVIEIYARLGEETASMSTILDGTPCRGRRRP